MPDHHFKHDAKAAFMCEGGASLCDERVPLFTSDYDASAEPVLARGHGPGDGELGKCAVCGRPHRRERRKRR